MPVVSIVKDLWHGGSLQYAVDARRQRATRVFRVRLDSTGLPGTDAEGAYLDQAVRDIINLIDSEGNVHPQESSLPILHVRGIREGALVFLITATYGVGRSTGGGGSGVGILLQHAIGRFVGERVYRTTSGEDGTYAVDGFGLPAGLWHGGMSEVLGRHIEKEPPPDYQWMRPATRIVFEKLVATNPLGSAAVAQSYAGTINNSDYFGNPTRSLRFDGVTSREVLLSSNQHVWDVELNFTRIANGQWFGQRLKKNFNQSGAFEGFSTDSFQLHSSVGFSGIFQWFFSSGPPPSGIGGPRG